MAKITKEAVHKAYEQAKLFYDKKIGITKAISELPIAPNSVRDYIYNYRQMRNGVTYKRAINQYATRYYLNGIYNDNGKQALEIALSALNQHINYYNSLGVGKNRVGSKIYEEFTKLLKTNSKSGDIETIALEAKNLIEDISEIQNSRRIITQKELLINARMGQGKFRQDVIRIEKKCRVTGLCNADLLIASHIKPWSKCNDEERLNGYNGLLLSPHLDKLFDSGHLSFQDNGDMILSQTAKNAFRCWNIAPTNVGVFHANQLPFLIWHRQYYKLD